jgi:hypothetical protein
MDDLIKTDFISIFTWLNTTGCFSYLKERPKLDVDKFTYINKDTIQNIELYMKSLRLIIDDEILSAVLIEKAKKEGKPIILTSFYELSCLVFNKANSDTYKKIKESLNALKTSVIKVQKGGQGFIFNFIDSLKFDDMDNEKGSILIRLSNEIYEFYIKKSPYLVSIDLNVYRTLTGGRIQKLLFLYLKSVNLTIPTPLTKIQEILQLQHIRPQDFKRTFTINLINALKKEGIYIKIQDDKIIYKHIKKLCQTIPQSQPPHEKQSLPFSAEEIKDMERMGINQMYILSLAKTYSDEAVVKAAKKVNILKKDGMEIKNPAGFLQKMLEKGTYKDIADIDEKQKKKQEENKKFQILKPHKLTIEEEEEAQRQVNKSIEEKIKEFERGEPDYENN